MRVAVNAMILTDRDTGVGVWLRGLIGALDAAAGTDEYLIYHGSDAADLPVLRSQRCRYVPVGVRNARRPGRIAYEQMRLARRLRRDAVDVLHCPAYVQPLYAPVPCVLTLHDLFALTHPQLCKRLNVWHFRLLVPPGVRRSRVIHCTSQYARRCLGELFPGHAAKAHVITPGVDELFQPSDDETERRATLAQLGLDEPPLLFVGNLEPKKNLPLLLAAYRRFRTEWAGTNRLLMVGGPGWRNRDVHAALAAPGLAGDAVRMGYIPRGELPAIYRASLALVFPSLVEGFGLPPLEAMACGTPVICTLRGGLSESAGRAALIVPHNDPDELARAMRRMVDSAPLRADLSRAGLARARKFRWRDRAEHFRRLYRLAAQR